MIKSAKRSFLPKIPCFIILLLFIQAGLVTRVTAQNNVTLIKPETYVTTESYGNSSKEYTYIIDESNIDICDGGPSNLGAGIWTVAAPQNKAVSGIITYEAGHTGYTQCKVIWINNEASPVTLQLQYKATARDQYGFCGITLQGSWDITVETCQSLMSPYDTPKTICVGDKLTSVYKGPGYTYEWSNAPYSPIPGATNSTYTPTVSGYYTLKTTNSNGCSASRTMQVLLTAPPDASISTAGSTTICKGGSTLLQANTGVGLSYQWQNNNVAISGATASSYSATTTGNFNVSVGNAGCSSPSSSIAIVAKPLAVVPVITASGPTNFCIGGSVNLSIPDQGTEFTYQWYKDNNAITVNGNGLAYSVTESGSYTIKVDSKSGCGFQISTPVSVTVTSTPPDAIITSSFADPITLCTGQTVLLTGNSGTGYTYQWYNGSAISGATNSSYTASLTGTYVLKVTAPTGCLKTSAAKVIKVQKPLPATVGYTNSNATIGACGGFKQISNLTVTDYGNITFQWYKNNQPITGATESSLAISEIGTNDYYYIVTGNSTCGGPASVPATPFSGTVTVKPPLPVTNVLNQAINPVDAPYLFICKTESMTLSLTNDPPSGFDLRWYKESLTYPYPTTLVSQNKTFTVTDAGFYYAVFSNSYCNTISNWYPDQRNYSVEIGVVDIPVASITSSGPLTFCKGGAVTLNANTGTYLKYQWNLNGAAISGATAASYAATQSGSYTVTVNNGYSITTGACSIPAVSNAIVVNVNQPIAAITPPTDPTTFCSGGSIVLQANKAVAPDAFTYQWYNNTAISGATKSNYTATTSGRYSVKITDKNGCSNQATAIPVTVNANSPANAVISTATQAAMTICTGKITVLSTTTAGEGLKYQWYTTNTGLIAGETTSKYTASKGGNYYLIISSTNCGAAKTSNTLAITENPLPDVTISVTGNTAYTNDIANDRSIELCSGQLELKVPYVQGSTYTWSGGVAGNNGTCVVTKTGNYAVTIIDQNGCTASSFPNGKTAALVINNPSMVSNDNLVYCTAFETQPKLIVPGNVISGTTFQWFKDGTAISGAVGKEYLTTPPAQGNYSVTLTNRCGVETSDLAHVKKANSSGDFVVSCNSSLVPGKNTTVYFSWCGLIYVDYNNFIIELSDARGSFACPISSTTVPYTVSTSGSPVYSYQVSLPVPSNAVSSNKYRVRVRSTQIPRSANTNVSLSGVSDADNGFDISVLDNQGNKYIDPQYPSDFTRTWTNQGLGKVDGLFIDASSKFYFGNFDGDAGEEMLCTGTFPPGTMTYASVLKYVDGNWKRVSTENITISIGYYIQNGELIVGDFDGNGIDEILATVASSGENVLLKFQSGTAQNGTWITIWRDNSSHPMRPYKSKKYRGNFDGGAKDEVLACDYAGWTTIFEWNGSNFIWSYWSDYGNTTLTPFINDRDKLRIADYNGDGDSEILVFGATNAKLFHLDYISPGNRSWGKVWGTQGASNIAGWTYPLAENDRAPSGNIDNDNQAEVLLYNTTGTMVRIMHFENPTDGWSSNYMTNSFISDWPTGNSKYLFVKPVANEPAYLLAMKLNCNAYDIAMYKSNASGGWNYRTANSVDQTPIIGEPAVKSITIYPNPSSSTFNVVMHGAEIKAVEIVDAVGGVAWTNSDITESNCTVDAAQWDGGIYVVKVTSVDNEAFYSKVVIVK